jgi:hypothetical protein
VAICVLTALAGCGDDEEPPKKPPVPRAPKAPKPVRDAAPWSAPPNALELTRRAGLTPEVAETLDYHVHAHLDVFVNGRRIPVPAGIGINTGDPGVKHFQSGGPETASYGGIEKCDRPCISPLHTHDFTGVLHTESATRRPNRLGQFFTEWGVRLTRSCVGGYCRPDSIAVFVDGRRFTGDPAGIQLTDQKEIAIVIGSPPPHVPATYDFSSA